MKPILFTLLTFFVLYSCQKDETLALTGNAELIGTWINPQYNDTLVTYYRADFLNENEPGFVFMADNKLICRQNSGWCGTPPISTADYEGNWAWNDPLVVINTDYWGGKVEYTWKVISLTNQKLVISVVNVEYQ